MYTHSIKVHGSPVMFSADDEIIRKLLRDAREKDQMCFKNCDSMGSAMNGSEL